MVTVTKEGSKFIIVVDESEMGVEDTGLLSFFMSAPCRHPKHSHEQILQQLLKLTGIPNRYTTVQREKLILMGVKKPWES